MQSLPPPWVRNDSGAPIGSFSQPQQSSGDGAAGTIGVNGAVAWLCGVVTPPTAPRPSPSTVAHPHAAPIDFTAQLRTDRIVRSRSAEG